MRDLSEPLRSIRPWKRALSVLIALTLCAVLADSALAKKGKGRKRKRKCKLKRNCFACGEPNLLHGRQPDHTQSRANQKYTLSCCGRLVCTECLASFGKRVSACAVSSVP